MMGYSRRDLFKGIVNPGVWTGKPDSGPEFPEGEDIVLIADDCIAWGKGLCEKCGDACPEHAIFFVGLMNPRILHHRCTLCGDCVPVCPTRAIHLRPSEPGEPT